MTKSATPRLDIKKYQRINASRASITGPPETCEVLHVEDFACSVANITALRGWLGYHAVDVFRPASAISRLMIKTTPLANTPRGIVYQRWAEVGEGDYIVKDDRTDALTVRSSPLGTIWREVPPTTPVYVTIKVDLDIVTALTVDRMVTAVTNAVRAAMINGTSPSSPCRSAEVLYVGTENPADIVNFEDNDDD